VETFIEDAFSGGTVIFDMFIHPDLERRASLIIRCRRTKLFESALTLFEFAPLAHGEPLCKRISRWGSGSSPIGFSVEQPNHLSCKQGDAIKQSHPHREPPITIYEAIN